MRLLVVGSPSYFERRPVPQHPRELVEHTCMNWAPGADEPAYRWEFTEDGRDSAVNPEARVQTTDPDLNLRLALARPGSGRVLRAIPRLLPLLPSPQKSVGRVTGAHRLRAAGGSGVAGTPPVARGIMILVNVHSSQAVCTWNQRLAQVAAERDYASCPAWEAAWDWEEGDERPGEAVIPTTDGPALVDLMKMSEDEWDAFTRGSAMRRAGYAGFQRNVAVALGNWLAGTDTLDPEAVGERVAGFV